MDSGSRPAVAEVLRAAFGTTISASAAPYGYTISIWSTGAVLMHLRGSPNVLDVASFIVGALTGFAALGLLAHGALQRTAPLEEVGERVLAGMLHWFAVGCAVGIATLLAEIHSWVAWALGSFAATSVYLLIASAQLAIVALRSRRTTNTR